jgi:hypothetical protein
MDITMRFLAEIGFVSLLGKLVVVARENAGSSYFLECNPEPPDATKEVDESKRIWIECLTS